MKTQRKRRRSPGPKTFRCAVYIRDATDHEGGRKWNSLPRQREAIQAFIASRKRQGWVCLPDVYEDSGQSGATLKRPALQRLLADVEAGKVDCVVIHTVDRLSRSISCHAKALALFRQHGVTVVTVLPTLFLVWGDRLEDGWLADAP
jgi:site-specific DNA recombinase